MLSQVESFHVPPCSGCALHVTRSRFQADLKMTGGPVAVSETMDFPSDGSSGQGSAGAPTAIGPDSGLAGIFRACFPRGNLVALYHAMPRLRQLKQKMGGWRSRIWSNGGNGW